MASRKAAAAGSSRRNRRQEVLEAAVLVFYAKGYPSASVQDVAEGVGVLKGSLYHYIDSKEDLLASVFEDSDAQSLEVIARVEAMQAPAIERLRAFVYEWSVWHLRNIERASVYLNEWRHLKGERLARVKRKRREYEEFVIGIVEDARAEGDADPQLDARYACFYVLSAINGLPRWYRRRGADTAERIAELYAELAAAVLWHKPVLS